MNGALRRALRLSPLLIPFTLVFLGGVALAVVQSLGYYSLVPVEKGVAAAYARLAEPWFWESFGFTCYVAGASAALSVAAGAVLAYGVWKLPRRLHSAALVYKIPLVLPHIAVAFIVLVLWTQSGFVASVVHSLGFIETPADFPALLYAGNGAGLVMAYSYKGTGFVILLAFAALQRLDPRLITSAAMLGASRTRIFFTVVLPRLAPTLHACFIILFLYAFGAFDIPYLLSESSPGMLSIQAYDLYFKRDLANRPAAMAILVAMAAFSTVFVALYTVAARRLQQGARKL